MKVPAWKKTGGQFVSRFFAPLFLALFPVTVAAVTPSGTVIRHDFTARFAVPVPREVRSNQTQVSIRDLSDPALVPPRDATTAAGVAVDFLHTLTNRGNFADSFQLRAVLAQGGFPEGGAQPALHFYAADGQTPLPGDAAGVQVIGPIAPGASVDLVLRVTPPAGSEGRVVALTVTATSLNLPERSVGVADRVMVPVPGGITAVKGVSPEGGVLPGAELSYRIALANVGSAPVSGVRVVDPLDPLLEYRQGSALLPAGLGGSVSYDVGSRSLVFDIPALPAGFTGELTFGAAVAPGAAGNATIANTAQITSEVSATPTPTNTTVNTVLARALLISKAAGSAVAEAGDVVSYSVRVENVGASVLTHVTVNDRLPRGLRYLKGSSSVDGLPAPDPAGGSEQLSWDLGSMAPGGVRLLGYRCVLSGDVPVGTSVNWVQATGTAPTGLSSLSPSATAAVKVRPSILGDKAVILGRVFRDRNGNGVPDPGEPGEPGVKVYLEDGSFVISDGEGAYSFTGVSAGSHVLKLDRSTLDPRWVSVPYNTAFAGVGWSQFVTVPFGGPARGDFALAERAAGPTGPTRGGQAPAEPVPSGPTSPTLRDWILVGLGNVTLGAKAVSGKVERIDKDDRFDEGIFHDERLAFFTRGSILDKYLLTAAYDSDKERRDGVFQAIDPEKYYPVYGDASDIGYDAQSRGKLYLKLENGRSHLMAGDYRTDLSENEFSRYDRALNGVKLELQGETVTAKGFESRTEETVMRDDIPGNGTSGHYLLSRRPVFENSERVRIEVRDRYHSERVISISEKLRYADYSIDYNAGSILFKEPVPSLDPYLNPVTIVVNYQAAGPGKERYVYGGRLLAKSKQGSYLGGTAVVEQETLKDTTLYGLDAGLLLGDRVTIKGEGAVSETLEHGRGSAWKAELAARLADSLGLGLYYRKVEADFSNRSMTGSEIGTEKFGGRLDYRAPADTLLFAESFVQKEELSDRRLAANHLGLARKFTLWEAEGGLKLVQQEKGGTTGHSDLLYAGVKGALTGRLDATLRREQLLSASSVAEYQTKTFLKLDYRLSERTKAFFTEEIDEGSPVIRQATLFGLETRLSDRTRLTTGYKMSEGLAGYSQQSNVDLHTRLVEQERLTLDSRSGYQLENAMSQQRGQAILGLNSRYRAAEGLYLSSSLERVQTVQGSGGTRTAFTLAGEYLRRKELKLTGRYEIGSGPGETTSLYGASAAWKLTPSLTLLGKATLWDRDAGAGGDRTFDGYLGGSFRPPAGSPLQLLTLARYKLEERGSLPGVPESRSFILSAEPTYRMVKQWTAQGKYAGKFNWTEDGGGKWQSYTDLILAGLSYDLAERWELSAYLKLMNQYDAGMHSLGAVGSAGYRVYRNVVLSAGYNYARLDDRDLTGETFQGQGPFLGVKVKFDEDIFERAKVAEIPVPPAVQPAPVVLERPRAPAKPVPALLVTAQRLDEPLLVSGSAELFTLLVNGERARLPSTAVSLTRERLEGSLDLKHGRLTAPVVFVAGVEQPEQVASWRIEVTNREGVVLRTLKGKGAPQQRISWDGATERRTVEQGEIYQYQLQVTYLDGSVFGTGPELFGVNRREALLLTLAGGSFVFDKSYLTAEGKRLLRGAARVLRAHPREKVIVEGHTDGIGGAEYNMALSKRRCDAAADFLVREEGISPARLFRRWYGKSRPVAENVTTPGRRKNRRVELKGDFQQKVPVGPDDRYRTSPFVTINGKVVPVDPHGRFDTTLPGETGRIDLEMGDSLGRYLAASLPLPGLQLLRPPLQTLVAYGSEALGVAVDGAGASHCMLSGKVEPGTTLELAGREVEVDGEGRFAEKLPLPEEEQVLGMVLRNRAGCSRLLNLRFGTQRQLVPVPEARR